MVFVYLKFLKNHYNYRVFKNKTILYEIHR